MAIPVKQIWDDYVVRSMAHRAATRGGLFANGVTQIDTNPVFTGGDTRHRVPYIDDLATILGDDDHRLVDDDYITIKSVDGRQTYAPIVRRGDAFGQNEIDQTQTGTDALTALAPQIADRNLNMIQKRLINVTTGAFATGGPLVSSHVYGDTATALGAGDPQQALALTFGEDSDRFAQPVLVVNSRMKANLISRALVSTLPTVASALPSLYTSGSIQELGGARIAVNDRLCPAIQHDFTAANATDLFTVTAHNFAAGDAVVFTGDDLPAGVTAGTTYYVIASGLTADDFKVSETSGGSTITITDDGTGTMTVTNNEQYKSYLLGQAAYYVGYQRGLDITDEIDHRNGGKKYVKYWTMHYAPTIRGLSFVASDPSGNNPTDATLATGASWSAVGEAYDIGVVQLTNKLG